MNNNEEYKLYNGDCLTVMDKLIEQGVKVDAVITDPPYGTTACKWDTVIPFDEMWNRLNKLIKPTGVACLNTNRKFIGIEINEKYFNIAKDRIEAAILTNKQKRLF